ncbi:hypothetical protein PFISCL1PPCAC_19355 [Pristionchus fissidentatus]|uniref:C2H2-type domain-containing protein n=1 Tax=Pristionchus fissidentatus TaxID=1538716 RepID=A0AAV5WBI9_9BILA|nr:hypothetical protein PFISCL1PPCAC_19355 [Pristionchus fissidentatus]
MSYRSGAYLIRDDPSKEVHQPDEGGLHEEHEDEEDSERICVDDDRDAVVFSSDRDEPTRSDLLAPYQPEYKKKYTFTQRRPVTEYYCEICKKVFRHPSKIEEHKRKHTGHRPFQCEICHARFTQGGALKVHIRAHRGELPYKCSYCDRHFTTPYNQRTHEMQVHVRGGRLHRDRMQHKEGDNRHKSLAAASSLAHQKEVERRERVEETQVYECCVPSCGYQHVVREMVENHVTEAHAEMWENGGFEGMEGEDIDVEGEEIVHEGEEGAEYQNYAYYEYVEHDAMMDEHEVVVMTEEEVAAVDAANAAAAGDADDGVEMDGLVSSTSSMRGRIHLSAGNHPDSIHPSSMGVGQSALVIEADEHIDEESMRKAMADERRTRRMLTLARMDGMVKEEEMYQPPGYSAAAPLVSYEVEVMTTRDGSAAAASTMHEDDDEDPQPIFSELSRAQMIHDDMISDEGTVRLLTDPRPPLKGRRGLQKWEEAEQNLEMVEVDVSMLDEVLPQQRNPRGSNRRRKRNGPIIHSRNLDWIIDAVATGKDVDQASPHNRKKPIMHTCEYCGKVDKYPSKIEAHMRTHTGERPFKCDMCGMAFAQRTPLRMHMRRHFGQRQFECEFDGCDAKFISQALLNAHQNSRHSSHRRFVCMKGCGRWFANGRNQRQHELKCTHTINRTTVNTDYNLDVMEQGSRYVVESTDDGGPSYLDGEGEEDEVDVDEEEEEEGEYHGGMLHDETDNDIGRIHPNFL